MKGDMEIGNIERDENGRMIRCAFHRHGVPDEEPRRRWWTLPLVFVAGFIMAWVLWDFVLGGR